MTTRYYFFVPDIEAAKLLVPELKSTGLEDKDIHVVAREDTSLEPLPDPDILLTSDLVSSAKRGAVTGGTLGLVGGLAAMSFPAAGLTLGGGALLFSTALGGALGTWFSTLIGVSVPNEEIRKFQDQIDSGQVMILIQSDDDTADEVISLVGRKHPDAIVSRGELADA